MTLRSEINRNIFDLIEFFTDKCLKKGTDAEYLGVKLLIEPSKFVSGIFFCDSVHYFLHCLETGNKNVEKAEKAMHFIVDFIRNDKVNTWGKLSFLRGLCNLKKNGKLSVLSVDELSVIEEKTRYDDFYDKATGKLKGCPSNYYQVAMACAGLRENVGFENEGYCDVIKDTLLALMSGYSTSGWMDENPPYGRFDRYTFMICAELADSLDMLGKEVPAFALKNLKDAADLALACANPNGDGVVYGRSLSIHGDCAFLEIFSTALRHGLIDEKDIPTVLSYSLSIVKKANEFWYDSDRKSYNLWLDGRTTNNYRQIPRLMEVNLDMCNHMLTTLSNFEAAGLADTECELYAETNPHSFGNPYVVKFVSESDKKRFLYCFVRKGKLIQLPLISAGNMRQASAYLPFPAITGQLEAHPETQRSYLVPEFYSAASNTKYLPAGFYTEISDKNSDGKTVVTAVGKLAALEDGSRDQKETDYGFTAVYTFTENEIVLSFETDLPDCSYILGYGAQAGAKVKVTSETEPEIQEVAGKSDFFTPHGEMKKYYVWKGKGGKVTVKVDISKL